MSFNIKNSFVSRAVVEDDKEKEIESDTKDEVVIQEQYDPRTLYERLQEQKNLKEEKFLEESRLSNQIKKVDAEEAEYFKTLADEKEKLEYERKIKEQLELEEYRQAVEARAQPVGPAINVAESIIPKPKTTIVNTVIKTKPKGGALFLVKKKKREEEEEEEEPKKKSKTEETKPKPAISLLSDAYGDISSSDEDD